MIYDYVIIGGGIIGISTAWQLKQRLPNKSILLIEKEDALAKHQTGHNSGVVHAGVYYPPGSLKSQFCREGLVATLDFCKEKNIHYSQCGKILVATNSLELERMKKLYEQCKTNELNVEWLDKKQLIAKEPNITGLAGVLVKDTAIVDYSKITKAMAQSFEESGGELQLNTEVKSIKETPEQVEIKVSTQQGEKTIQANFLISCSGLMADRLTKMMGIKTDFQIIPFRGEYYQLPEKHNDIVNHLIYPIPDPGLPFLGIHLTRMIDGSTTIGPNAVQGWKREGYGKINISLPDILEMILFKGFWNVLRKYWKIGLIETKNSWYKKGYLKLVQLYCPSLRKEDLKPYPAGIRAQAVLKNGALVHDFLFLESPRSLHVCNAPSPAATSAIPIGAYLCDKIIL